MKAVLKVLCCVVVFAVSAQAQLPDRNHSFSLDVQLSSNGGAITRKDKMTGGGGTDTEGGHYFSSTQTTQATQARSLELEVTVRNFRNAPDTARLEWFFIGSPIHDQRKFVFDQGGKELALSGGESRQETLQSKELKQTTTKATTNYGSLDANVYYLPNSSAVTSGARPKGWIIRLVNGDSVLAVKASASNFEDAARTIKAPQELASWISQH